MFDSHCHLDAVEFAADRAAVLRRARQAGVTRLLIPAVTRSSWPLIAKLCADDSALYPAYGLHPMFLAEHATADVAALGAFVRQQPTAAIGECGLDFFLPGLEPQRQLEILRPQLQLARELDLPVILHARRALDPLLQEVRKIGRLRGIVHSFAGSEVQAQQWVRQGFLLGFGGPVTYPRALRLQAVVAQLPLASLALETDAPDQPLCGHQGQRNEPAMLPEVLNQIARLRRQEPALIASATTRNLLELIRRPA